MDMDLKRKLDNGLTVAELIDELQSMDPNARVVFTYPSGDYWRSELARVVETVDEAETRDVRWSEYHRELEYKPRDDDEDDERDPEDVADDEDDEPQTLVIINMG